MDKKEPRYPTAVNRYIAAEEEKITQAMGREDFREMVLITTENGEYVWKADIPASVLRNA